MVDLSGKNILITGAARRIGKSLAIAVAQRGAHVIIHYGQSQAEAEETRTYIHSLGGQASILKADLSDPDQIAAIIPKALEFGSLFALINNASIFETLHWWDTRLDDWNRNLMINLTAPFLLSQAFAKSITDDGQGCIINILDWRALRPGQDHFPYTISKAALVALTKSLAQALAPRINVNGIALGAILPPSDGGSDGNILDNVPMRRWAELEEVERTILFLLEGPTYITGEVLHLDGGRHLV